MKSPLNSAVITPYKIRNFDGVVGPDNKVVRKTGIKGQDFSTSIANEVYDLQLGRKGAMLLREGFRKINNTGKHADISGIMGISVNGRLAYGLVIGGSLDINTIPTDAGIQSDMITLTPKTDFGSISNATTPTTVGEPIL